MGTSSRGEEQVLTSGQEWVLQVLGSGSAAHIEARGVMSRVDGSISFDWRFFRNDVCILTAAFSAWKVHQAPLNRLCPFCDKYISLLLPISAEHQVPSSGRLGTLACADRTMLLY